MSRYLKLFLTVPLFAACGGGGEKTSTVGGVATALSSSAKDSLILVKDSLLAAKERQLSLQSQMIGDAATSARLVSEINKDLAKIRNLKVKSTPTTQESAAQNMTAELSTMQQRVNAVVVRLNASESQLRRIRRERAQHADVDSAQIAQLRDFERSIADLRSTVEQQKSEIGTLRGQVDSLTRANVALTARNEEVIAKNVAMVAHEDSVFMIVGTEKELIAKGLIRKEGGTKLLFGRGKTLVPGRDLAPTAFTTLSKSRDLAVKLPNPEKRYRVVSRQSLGYTDYADAKDMVVQGTINIKDPERFWTPSRYLILVER